MRRKGVGVAVGLALVVTIALVSRKRAEAPEGVRGTRTEGEDRSASPEGAVGSADSPGKSNNDGHSHAGRGSPRSGAGAAIQGPTATSESPAPVGTLHPREAAILSTVDALLFKRHWRRVEPKDVDDWFASHGLSPSDSLEPLAGSESRRKWSAASDAIGGTITVTLRSRSEAGPWDFESAVIDVPWTRPFWESPESTIVPLFPVIPDSASSYEEAKVWKLPGGRSVWLQRLGDGERGGMRIAMEASEE